MVSLGAFLPAGGDGAFHAGVFRLDEVDQIGVQIVGTRGFRVESELFIELPEHIPDDGFLVLHGEHPDAEILRFVFFPELLAGQSQQAQGDLVAIDRVMLLGQSHGLVIEQAGVGRSAAPYGRYFPPDRVP